MLNFTSNWKKVALHCVGGKPPAISDAETIRVALRLNSKATGSTVTKFACMSEWKCSGKLQHDTKIEKVLNTEDLEKPAKLELLHKVFTSQE